MGTKRRAKGKTQSHRVIEMDDVTSVNWLVASKRAVVDIFGKPFDGPTVMRRAVYQGPTGKPVRMAKRIGSNVPEDMRYAVEEAARLQRWPMSEVIRQCLIKTLGR